MLDQLEVELIQLKLPFRLNHVNCFVAEGYDGYVVIDAGLHDDLTVKRWNDVLGDKEVTDIYITHYHPDHFGYAGGLQQKYDARVSMSETDANDGLNAWEDDFLSTLLGNYKRCNIPEHIAKEMYENTVSFHPKVTPYPKIDHYFREHDRVKIGKYEYKVIFTPGHSDGLITFYNDEKKVLFSTDHILPHITPNISYWFHGDPNPLKTYLHSLEKVRKLEAEYVIPSHGKPFHDANKRIDEIIAHHDNRLNETLKALKEYRTVYDVCNQLFDFQLTIHETRFAIGETVAHLEYLRYRGEVIRDEIDGVWLYEKK